MNPELSQLPALAASRRKAHRKLFRSIAVQTPKDLDRRMADWHEEVFDETDCLQCANCCKTAGPLLLSTDIERIARRLRLKVSVFTNTYLRKDEEGDWVMKQLPCPFLQDDNSCQIYDIRPKACREYPHTDRRKIHQIANLTVKNVAICPAAFRIVERLREAWQRGSLR